MSLNLSIRHRLLLTSTLILGSFTVLFPLSQIATFSNTLEQSERKRLEADARTVLAAAQVHNGQLLMPQAMENPRFNQVQSDLIALIYDANGKVLWRSSSAQDFMPNYLPRYNRDEVVFSRLNMANQGSDYFIHDWDVEVEGQTYSILTGDRTTAFDENLQTYQRQLRLWMVLGFGGLLVLLTGGLTWALRPLRRIYRQLIAVEQGKITQLQGEYPAELERLALGLNSLLKAERSRMNRYKTTLSDLAHGLKTPLAVISESCRNLPTDEQRILKDQIQGMNQLVNFHLQRAMPVRPAWPVSPLQLPPILEKICLSLDKVYCEKNVNWHIGVDAIDVLITEAEALEIFGNILENAYRLCLNEVKIAAVIHNDDMILRIEDDGPGVPVHLRQQVLERGRRADTQHEGQGIGLGLVVEMLQEMNGKLHIEDSDLGGAAFCIHLPTALSPPKASLLR